MKDLENLINSYPTNSEYGFTDNEIKEFIALNVKQGISQKHYNDAMGVNTVVIVDDIVRYFHCDVLSAIRCGIDKRGLTNGEWD